MIKLVAKIKHTESGNLVFTLDKSYDYTQFDTLKSKCEICNTVRYRNVSYIVLEDEKLIQVGSSCLMKLFPRELSLEEKAIIQSKEQYEFDLDLDILNVDNVKYFNLKNILLTIIHKKINPKSFYLSEELEWFKKNQNQINIEDLQTLEKMLNWYNTTKIKNEFIHNIIVALNSNNDEYISLDYVNIIKWAYSTYLDYQLSELSKGLESNEFTIKEVQVKEKYRDYHYDYRGIDRIVYRFIDTNNNIIEFDTSSNKDYTTYVMKKVSCTIKSKYDSKLGKVTKISRLKILK